MTANILPKKVNHSGPKGAKILVVGEAPGQTEWEKGFPFAGVTGNLLRVQLANNGVDIDNDVRFANLCNYRPYENRFTHLLNTPELAEGISELSEYIRSYPPNLIVALGAAPLFFLTGKGRLDPKTKNYTGIGSFRGSILPYTGNRDIKVIPTYHPSAVQRQPKYYPIFNIDIGRIAGDSKFKEFRYTPRNYYIAPTDEELYDWLDKIKTKKIVSCDIENIKGTTNIICVGFGLDRHTAVVIPYDSIARINVITQIIEDPNIEKIFHFGTHDVEIFYLNGINAQGYTHDTMALHNSIAPELNQSLAFISSVWTREPYYKSEGRGDLPDDSKAWSTRTNKNTVYIYNGKDCCVTIENFEEMMKEITPKQLRTYQYMMEQIALARIVSRNGMPVDIERRERMKMAMFNLWHKLQLVFNTLCGKIVNVNSPQVVARLLYDELKLPVKRNKTGGRATGEDQVVELISYCKGEEEKVKKAETKLPWLRSIEILKLLLEIRGIRKLISQYLDGPISADNRIRGTFGPYTETWRWQCSSYADDTGINLQTFPRAEVKVPARNEIDNLDLNWVKSELEKIRAERESEEKDDSEELEEVA